VVLGEYGTWRLTRETNTGNPQGYADVQQACGLLANFFDQNYESEWYFTILVGGRPSFI
jgi:hypothetical protein